jgi:hypothetical protein
MGYSTINLGDYTLYITSMTPVKKQKTRKTILGKSLVETSVIGLSAQQWEISLNGIITGTTSTDMDTHRTEIESLDSTDQYGYSDGLRTGTFMVKPGSLSFSDDGNDVGNIYRYSLVLVEW